MEEGGAEDSKHRAMRMRKMAALDKQANSAKSRLTMRKIVSEQLSHPLLEQMRSKELTLNPLADEEDEFDDAARRVATHLTDVQQWMLSEGGVIGDGSASDGAAQVEDEATLALRRAASLAAAAETSPDETSEAGVADLVALKAVVVDHDMTADGSGLDADEFVAALGQLWTSHSHQDLMHLFMQIDADSDGRVTWQELLTFLLQKDQEGDENDINRFVRDLDTPAPAAGSAHAQPISQLVPLPDKEKYLSIGRDATMRVWQYDTCAYSRTVALPEKCWINAAAYCETHRRLALASAHSKLFIFDTNSMRPQKTWRLKTVGTAVCVVEQAEVSSAWAGCLVLGDKDGMVYVYDWEKILAGELVVRHEVSESGEEAARMWRHEV